LINDWATLIYIDGRAIISALNIDLVSGTHEVLILDFGGPPRHPIQLRNLVIRIEASIVKERLTCRGTADEPAAVDPVDAVAHGVWQLETKEGVINLPCRRQCRFQDWLWALCSEEDALQYIVCPSGAPVCCRISLG